MTVAQYALDRTVSIVTGVRHGGVCRGGVCHDGVRHSGVRWDIIQIQSMWRQHSEGEDPKSARDGGMHDNENNGGMHSEGHLEELVASTSTRQKSGGDILTTYLPSGSTAKNY